MRPYIAILRQHLAASVQFRVGFWAKVSTNMFWGYVRSVIVSVFFLYGTGDRGALSLSQTVSIVWLDQIAMNLLPGFGGQPPAWDRLRTGDVGTDLCRPLSLYWNWYAGAAATRLAPFLMAIVPVSLIGLLVPAPLGLAAPASALHLSLCLVTLITGLFVGCAAECLCCAVLMDVRLGMEPARMIQALIQVLSGLTLPLQLWPESWQTVLYYQPFAAMMDLPLRFYVGAAPLSQVPRVLLVQLFWGTAFILLGRAWIGRNLKKLVVQGG